MKAMTGTKEQIFNKALELFGKKGYDAVSIRNIVKEVGIKESSFYNHFPGKSALLDEVFNLMDTNLKRTKPSNEEIDQLTDNLDLYSFLKHGMDRFMRNWEEPEAKRIWYVVSMEQYRNPRAAHLIIKESERVMKYLSTAFFFFQQKRKMKDGDPMLLAHLYGFSMRAIHLDYTLRCISGDEPEYSYNKIYNTIKVFADQYSL
jgi:AcrR family transcriptional regulator